MAHEFESGFYTRKPAWHGLGIVLKDVPTIEEAIVAAGVDWNVIEKPLYTDLGQTYENKARKDDLVLAKHVATHKALVRETDNSILGIVGEGYKPVQNREAFQWFDFLLDAGDATLEAGGSLRFGKRIWVLAKMKNGTGEVLNNDTVESYLLLSNAHDGTMGVWLMFTPIRVVCMNTLSSALSTANGQAKIGKAISIRHTESVTAQLEFAKSLVDTASRTFSDSLETYKEFARKRMNDKQFGEYFDRVFWGDHKVNMEKIEAKEKNPRDTSRVFAKVRELFECGTGQDIAGVRGTVWAGYNAFTEFVDHHRANSAESRLNGTWFGGGNALRSRAFKEAEKLVRI